MAKFIPPVDGRCHAQYERPGGRHPGDRVVDCARPFGHDGAHEDEEGGAWVLATDTHGQQHDPVANYLRIKPDTIAPGEAARTIEIRPDLLFDIDTQGQVLGIERIRPGDVGEEDLRDVIRALRYVQPTPEIAHGQQHDQGDDAPFTSADVARAIQHLKDNRWGENDAGLDSEDLTEIVRIVLTAVLQRPKRHAHTSDQSERRLIRSRWPKPVGNDTVDLAEARDAQDQGDDLDAFIAEQRRDPAFAAAYDQTHRKTTSHG